MIYLLTFLGWAVFGAYSGFTLLVLWACLVCCTPDGHGGRERERACCAPDGATRRGREGKGWAI